LPGEFEGTLSFREQNRLQQHPSRFFIVQSLIGGVDIDIARQAQRKNAAFRRWYSSSTQFGLVATLDPCFDWMRCAPRTR
jgi:hypothetical protein